MSEETVPVAMVRRRRVSLTWLVPIAALVFVGVLVWNQVARDRGPTITIRFEDAGGIGHGSEIRYRGVTVGVVREVRLGADMQGVEVHAEMAPSAAGLVVEGSVFWIVRAELSLQRVAGLDTLIGPNYITVRPGATGGAETSSFVALGSPPVIAPRTDGSLRLVLTTDRLGTLSAGAPVLYREIRVGTIRGAKLAPDSTGVRVSIDIEPRYAPLVHERTRFWRSGGMGVDFGLFTGLSVRADSLEAMMMSSVSLATPTKKPGERAGSGAIYELADEPDSDWLGWDPEINLSNPPTQEP